MTTASQGGPLAINSQNYTVVNGRVYDAVIVGLVERAVVLEGVTLVVSEVPGEDATGLRDLAQKVRDKLAGGPAAVAGDDSRASSSLRMNSRPTASPIRWRERSCSR